MSGMEITDIMNADLCRYTNVMTQPCHAHNAILPAVVHILMSFRVNTHREADINWSGQ